jgi:hypothetical protein
MGNGQWAVESNGGNWEEWVAEGKKFLKVKVP